MSHKYDAIVVGAGIFGVTAALALKARGYNVALLDPGPLPHPLAASTDISKAVRLEYGEDETYLTLAEQARQGWLQWNEAFGKTLYHEVGLVMLSRAPLAPGSFEHESYQRLQARGYRVERLDQAQIRRRFPAWNSDLYLDGYFNPYSGFAESGRVVEVLLQAAQQQQVALFAGQTVQRLIEAKGRVIGVATAEGQQFEGDQVIVAAGSWTPFLLPELAPVMKATGQPVFHIKPDDPALFSPPNFAVFSADVSRTGWYGFPVHPKAGVIKIANHGEGQAIHPSQDERTVPLNWIDRFRTFLAQTFPMLAEAPIVKSHLCPYSDVLDGHFWISRHPERAGLTVASGGSGHAFKFAPLLGRWIVAVVEGQPDPALARFGWRNLTPDTVGQEGTRFREPDV